jgi:hypothetical protein
MTRSLVRSPWRKPALAFTLLLPLELTPAPTNLPSNQGNKGSATELKLTVAEEKDSYEIYSILLRTEIPPQWNITAWVIIRETQTFPNFGSANGGSRGVCIETSKDQEPIYLSAIDDYVAKDKRKLVLERKFDLPQYGLMGTLEISRFDGNLRALPGFLSILV